MGREPRGVQAPRRQLSRRVPPNVPASMLALRKTARGPGAELVEVPVPEPRAGEVLIRVSRAGINFADTHQRENAYLAKFELPFVPGGEVAGVVERGDGEVSGGTRVVGMIRPGRRASGNNPASSCDVGSLFPSCQSKRGTIGPLEGHLAHES